MPFWSLSLRDMLRAVEESPPLDAVEVVAAQLTDALGANHVTLLIATLSGGPLVRLTHVTGTAPRRPTKRPF
jgi:hypothetical protein